jgi:hypothetical protein
VPVAPVTPMDPAGPVTPVGPWAPAEPAEPAAPVGPCGPVAPDKAPGMFARRAPGNPWGLCGTAHRRRRQGCSVQRTLGSTPGSFCKRPGPDVPPRPICWRPPHTPPRGSRGVIPSPPLARPSPVPWPFSVSGRSGLVQLQPPLRQPCVRRFPHGLAKEGAPQSQRDGPARAHAFLPESAFP